MVSVSYTHLDVYKRQGQVCKFDKISDSEEKGIVIIHQELALIPYMSIGENMYLGNEKGKKMAINWDQTYDEADRYLKTVGLNESSHTLIKDIGVGKPVSYTHLGQERYRIAVELGKLLSYPEDGIERLIERAGDRKSTRLNSSHLKLSRMPSSA